MKHWKVVRSADSGEINRIAGLGDSLYHVVADTSIDREFDKVAPRWDGLTRDGQQMLDHAAQIADTADERAAVAAARSAFDEVRSIYEGRFLSLVKQGGSAEEVRVPDAQLDTRHRRLRRKDDTGGRGAAGRSGWRRP